MFWELVKESTIVQGSVTLLFTIAILIMLLIGKPVPTEVWAAYSLVLGYWFGTKTNYMAAKTASEIKGAIDKGCQ